MGIFKRKEKMSDEELYKKAELLSDYFCNAVTVYAFTNDEALRIASLAAAKIATGAQRAAMVAYLKAMRDEILDMDEFDHGDRAERSLMKLIDEINEKEWDLEDISAEKKRLRALNPEFARALDETDPTVFKKAFPDLLKE
ncbi:MAG: hypothetical protein ACE5GL_05780 [Calditrichia bacterium]